MSHTLPPPTVIILESGYYIIKDKDTHMVEKVWIDLTDTCYFVAGTIIEQPFFHTKFTVLEHLSSTPGNPSRGEDME